MSRTTIDLDPVVLRELKQRQREEKKSLGQLVSELLAGALHETRSPVQPFHWHSASLQPRIDLDDKEAVAEALGDNDPR